MFTNILIVHTTWT